MATSGAELASSSVAAGASATAGSVFPSCTYCLKKMGRVGVKCATCDDYFSCLHCFSIGAEIGSHRKEHDYFVLDAGQFRLFDKPLTWTATETLALLDGVEHHGFGNWINVAKCVPSRTPEDCATFFISMFIEGNLGRVFNTNKLDIFIQDHSTTAPPISLMPPVEMTLDDKRELGYYPMRDDFELEYDHNAEQLIADLVFRADDDEDQVAYKVWQMDRYRLRLGNRIKHKSVARDYGLVLPSTATTASQLAPPVKGNRTTNATPASNPQQQSQTQRNDMFTSFEFLRPLSRYKSADEMKMLIDNLKKEKSLKDRVKQLTNLQKSGVTKLKHLEESISPKRNGTSEKHRSGKSMDGVKAEPNGKYSSEMEVSNGNGNGHSHSDVIARRGAGSPESPSHRRSYPTRSTASPTVDEFSTDLADMMTDREKKMCHSMKLSYKAYFNAKTAILKDYLARRRGCPVKLRYPPGLDPAHRRAIIGLMTDNGWLDEDAT